MKDTISSTRLAALHPAFRDQAQAFVEDMEAALNLKIRIVQGMRTFAEQDAIYAQGRTKPGAIVSWAPAGSSYHNYGVAIDICPFKADLSDLDWKFNFEKMRPFAVKHGLQLGLDFPKPDSDHFQNKFGLDWREMFHRYTMKDFMPGTQFINLT